ncbi:MAG: cyclic peptide export ABC transporter [Methylococcaceae bacterium]|jgi:putative ATP-binding cassette transporter
MLKFLWQTSWQTIGWVLVIGISSGLCSASLVATINKALTIREFDAFLLWQFIGLCVFVLITDVLSTYLTAQLSENTIYKLRIQLAQLVIEAPYPVLYRFGKAKILANLTTDIATLSQAFTLFPEICIHTAIFIGCMSYLAWLSWQIALILLVTILSGMAVYKKLIHVSKTELEKTREEYDRLNKDFCTLTDGIKELKLNQNRAHDFINNSLTINAKNNRQHTLRARKLFIFSDKFLFVLYYSIVGLIIFALPRDMVSQEIMTGYVLVLLFISGHIAALTHSLPFFTGAKIALDKIQQVTNVLNLSGVSSKKTLTPKIPAFNSISLINLTHSFHNEKENKNFTLGPINLTFKRGELVFLVGGNGSGKTTLAMLLLGLYHPEQGHLRLNNIVIHEPNRTEYMQNFAVVFSDFFLFEQLFGIASENLEKRATQYINRLHLQHKVKVENDKLSTLELSQGQRKRLALLTAYLEDRPFYVFDEWAADQDPEFKHIFYNELLPELKSKGKTILAITHDDKYFHLADRCIKLEDGNVKEIWQPAVFSSQVI